MSISRDRVIMSELWRFRHLQLVLHLMQQDFLAGTGINGKFIRRSLGIYMIVLPEDRFLVGEESPNF